jgi:hypothetical protein
MHPIATTIMLLTASNVFMTFAWYSHLRTMPNKAWYIAALASWGIALFEYLLQVPANRIGYGQFSVGGHHARRVRAVFDLLHEGAIEARLLVGGAVPAGRRVLRVPIQARRVGGFSHGSVCRRRRYAP